MKKTAEENPFFSGFDDSLAGLLRRITPFSALASCPP